MAVTMSDNDDYDSDNWGSETAEFPTWPDGGQQPQKETITHTSGDNAPPDKRELQTEAIVASFTPRAYQLEMLEESLRRNIIVAMDTGSGKTHIAISRIVEELNRSGPEKLAWFLAPTVDLCTQQHDLLKSEIPAVQIKLLQGNDGVDKWKDQRIWDCIFNNAWVIVSTPQILYDALSNGYIRLNRLSLLIFDEAHNCVGNSPGVKIMQYFYQPNKARGLSVPHILGLSASPIMRSRDQSPGRIEESLDSVCRTPKKHRAELMLHVNLPEFRQILYKEAKPESELQEWTPALHSLHKIYIEYNMNKDPYIIQLQAENSKRSQRELEKVLTKQKTWCFSQLKSFFATSRAIFRELGAWAVDYYITQIVDRVNKQVSTGGSYLEDQLDKEKQHLRDVLKQLHLTCVTCITPMNVAALSDKVQQFIKALPKDGSLAGIVFVQRRATVAVLAHILAVHPHIGSQIRIGTVVGASQHNKKVDNLYDLNDCKGQGQTLHKFRSGQLDLLIATTVLEEGIDIPACNIVLCFDEPANLKSFVQRRGRARAKKSQLVLMQSSISDRLDQWQQLELEMKRIYADDMRELQVMANLESLEEDDGRKFEVESTGALLTLDNAVSRLYHFCALLPASQYVDLRPDFIYAEGAPAKVILPLCVDATVRITSGLKIWNSERNAKKDAAFQAYVALYKAGLVNDNLMPLLKDETIEELAIEAEKRPSIVEASTQINPWVEVARAWIRQPGPESLWKAVVTVYGADNAVLSVMEMILPLAISPVPQIPIYWSAATELLVRITASESPCSYKKEEIQQAQNDTWTILNAAFGSRFPIDRSNFAVLFRSVTYNAQGGSNPILNANQIMKLGSDIGLIRDTARGGGPYIFEEWLNRKPPANLVKHLYDDHESVPENVAHIAVVKLPRRTDFLHKITIDVQQPLRKHLSYALPHTICTVDVVPFRLTQFAMLMPSILHRMQVYMVGAMLSKTILADVKFNNLNLVVTAISASSAAEETNYQRLEFLGDSLLKICTSLQLLAEYPLWHEGYLTAKRDQIISNSRLARASLQVGLDKYIITKAFSGRKWRPIYINDVLSNVNTNSKRQMSTKVLADVVEALFGAAKLDGGISKALACMRLFLPEVDWQPLENRRTTIFERAPADIILPPPLELLERLIGYSFEKKVLVIEAMTHASCHSGTASLERLEFLGDAVLDSLIVNVIYNQEVELSHIQMHRLRTAFVNADFLAFMCMEWAIEQEVGIVEEDERTHSFRISTQTDSLALWKFMRRSSQTITALQLETSNRHVALRDDITAALANGSHYPWALLCRLQAPKFYSDIVESLLGAVYIDAGSLDVCERFIERMGILPYLRRVIRDNVHTMHPREELGILADKEVVKYVIGLKKEVIENVEKQAYTCEVYVGEQNIVSVNDGIGREEIRTKAAEAAVRILKERGAFATNMTMQEGFTGVNDVMDTMR